MKAFQPKATEKEHIKKAWYPATADPRSVIDLIRTKALITIIMVVGILDLITYHYYHC